jgi:membrane protein implicated in regulation of membrane protease activity
MDFSDPIVLWLALSGLLVTVELITGTFYLLVFSVCAAAAAWAAALHGPIAVQLVVFSVTAAFGVFGRIPAKLQAHLAKNAPVVTATDIGAAVTVMSVGENGAFRVLYRGAEWSATLQDSAQPVHVDQQLRVVRVEGIRLVCKVSLN